MFAPQYWFLQSQSTIMWSLCWCIDKWVQPLELLPRSTRSMTTLGSKGKQCFKFSCCRRPCVTTNASTSRHAPTNSLTLSTKLEQSIYSTKSIADSSATWLSFIDYFLR